MNQLKKYPKSFYLSYFLYSLKDSSHSFLIFSDKFGIPFLTNISMFSKYFCCNVGVRLRLGFMLSCSFKSFISKFEKKVNEIMSFTYCILNAIFRVLKVKKCPDYVQFYFEE